MMPKNSGSKARTRKTPYVDERPQACVGIGACATHLGSLESLLAALPVDTGATFLIALRADDDLALDDLVKRLAAASPMPLSVADDGAALASNQILVGRPSDLTTIHDGVVQSRPLPGPADTHGTVDSLLVSMAETYHENAVIVVLAGLGSHGTTAVAATKRCGGLSLAEVNGAPLEPEEGAITAAGIADLRLPVARMPREIAAYLGAALRAGKPDATAKADNDASRPLARVATILRNATGNDFHGYKQATFMRRIQRRMQVVQLDDIDRYIDRLRADPEEVQHLFQDLLIGVTQFFRDPPEFLTLERDVIPKLMEGKGRDDRIRVWVLGCATGEEAYSIGILLREHMARMDAAPHVQIFATDIDSRALAIARGGRYAESIAKEITPERLARWFVKEGATYCVVKELREMCIFSPHNLIKDAPFSRIDLLSCRNLLIYLNSDLQDRVIPIFHFALRPAGYLFLGPAENVTRHQKLFTPLDRKNRIFRRLEPATRVLPDFPLSPRSDRPSAPQREPRPATPQVLSGRMGRRVEQVAERYAPAYVVIDDNHEVLHFSGRTGRFLEPASGAATLNLLTLVHRDLRLDLRTALLKAAAQGHRVEARNVRMGVNGHARAIHIAVEPLPAAADEPPALAVFFQDAGPASETASGSEQGALTQDEHIVRLEAELRITKERLQTTIEELESTNEELKSSNEEYQSINEELQSSNEELETSKEELQAVNEELQTVNSELAHRVGELARTNSDLKNLLESTQIATLFLDNDLRLRSFTPTCADIFHVIDADVGRPIGHVTARVAYPELQEDARRVLKSLGHVEREVSGLEDDRRFLARVLPYRSVDNFIAGVVVTFLEITGRVRAETALRASERRFSEAQHLARIGVWEWNLETDQMWWSPVVYELWGLAPGDTPPSPDTLWIHPEDRARYDQALASGRDSGEVDVAFRITRADGDVRWLSQTGRMERSEQGQHMLGVLMDVTERAQTEARLKLLLGELQHRVRNILAVVRSIVRTSVQRSTDLKELESHLEGRLQTLARTYSMFTRTGEAAVDLEELVRDEMLTVAAHDGQVTLNGPNVRLVSDAAEIFALALHELATNSVKYGALSEPAGKLAVSWRVLNTNQGPRLSLEWSESGVRVIDTNPVRSGFGRDLLERGLPYELGARTSLEFTGGGVRALIELPLDEKVAAMDDLRRFDK